MRWRTCRLGDVITLKRGHDLPNELRQPGEFPVVSSSGVTGFHNQAKAQPPGVVTGRYGTLGEVFYIDQPYWPLNTALYVVDFKDTQPRFAAYFLENALKGYQSDKAAVPGVDRNVLHELQARVPDRAPQERIAEILSAYDDHIENNRRRMALLEKSARLLYREWFVNLRFPGHEHTRMIDGLPEGWERRSIENLAECVGGGTPSTAIGHYWEGGEITWVTPTDVTRNEHFVLLDSANKITESGLKSSSAKLVPPGTILMTSRASIGFFAITDNHVCTNQGFISIVPRDIGLSPFLLFQLSSRVDEIRQMGSGSTYPEVSRGKFRRFPVTVAYPCLISEFGSSAASLLQQIRVLKMKNQKLRAARDLLLPRLMNGELAV